MGTRPFRFARRAPFVENRESAERSGLPRTLSQRTPNCLSVPTARRNGPSAASNIRYGSIVACALPWRVASRPVTSAEPATLTSAASPVETRFVFTCDPTPSRSRACSAPRIAARADQPARTSTTATPTLCGGAVRGARDRHEAGRALREEVEARLARLGPDVSRPRDRAGDEARVQGAKRVHADAALLERARQEVLDEDVRPRRPAPHELLSLGGPEIHGRRLLAPVHGEEIRGLPVERRRLPAARDVAAAGVLDLDDARPHVREEHRRERPREDAREIEDDDAVERRLAHQNKGRFTTRIVVSSAGMPSPT